MDAEYKNLDLAARARAIVEREAQAVRALGDQFDDSLDKIVSLLLTCRGHILVAGAGTSHAVAQRFAHLLSCSGTPALCVNAAGMEDPTRSPRDNARSVVRPLRARARDSRDRARGRGRGVRRATRYELSSARHSSWSPTNCSRCLRSSSLMSS